MSDFLAACRFPMSWFGSKLESVFAIRPDQFYAHPEILQCLFKGILEPAAKQIARFSIQSWFLREGALCAVFATWLSPGRENSR